MSRHRLSALQQARQAGRGEVYLHYVSETEAALLTDSESILQLIKKKSGADVELDSNPSPVQNAKTVIVRGSRHQIQAAVRLINQKTGNQESISAQAQSFWLKWVEASFPDLESRAYFLPPVYFNRVPMTRETIATQDVLLLQSATGQAGQSNQPVITTSAAAKTFCHQPTPVQDSDVRDDSAMQRVLVCLQKMFEQDKEVLVGMNQLQYGQYLGESCYAAAAAQMPLPTNLPPALPRNSKDGDFDVLLIHRHFGLIVCEVKAFGDNVKNLNISQQVIDYNIRKKLTVAISQLNKAKSMLSHLVSDIAPDLRITKAIAVPNLTSAEVQQAISGDPKVIQEMCLCLGTTRDPADITGVCLCCDQMSDPKTPCDVSSHVLRELGHWWQRRVAGAGPDSLMTCDLYKRLIARFCGPATTITVPCISIPRLSVKTLGQAVWCTGECYTAVITLFPEQVHLLHTAPPKLFVTGPPGTGKTVVLLLMAIQWLRCGHDVFILCTGIWNRAVCSMLSHLLLQTASTHQTKWSATGNLHLMEHNFDNDEEIENALTYFSQKAKEGLLHIIVDEATPHGSYFQIFCEKLMIQVPRLHLWAASCFHGYAPAGWQVECLTRPLRSPPAVVREVARDRAITEWGDVYAYSNRGVPDHTDGPPVRRLYHRGQGHLSTLEDCVTCGREVANFLHSLRVGVPANATTSTTVTSASGCTSPPYLQWRDMVVLSWGILIESTGLVTALRKADIPVQVMEDGNIHDVATARSDVVWVAHGDRVRGLERKVVVCVEPRVSSGRLQRMSRCTAQLVIVSPSD